MALLGEEVGSGTGPRALDFSPWILRGHQSLRPERPRTARWPCLAASGRGGLVQLPPDFTMKKLGGAPGQGQGDIRKSATENIAILSALPGACPPAILVIVVMEAGPPQGSDRRDPRQPAARRQPISVATFKLRSPCGLWPAPATTADSASACSLKGLIFSGGLCAAWAATFRASWRL